jgi:MerR family redox-sensitive transcriptional activator SoxR
MDEFSVPVWFSRNYRAAAAISEGYELKCALSQGFYALGGAAMSNMPIGEVARLTGLASSTIRYYEKVGLLTKPARLSGQRRYGAAVIARLRIIQLARDAGFTIAETRTFLTGFSATTTPAARWRSLAERKLAEIDVLMARVARMRTLLKSSFHCGCLRIDDCERAILALTDNSNDVKPP